MCTSVYITCTCRLYNIIIITQITMNKIIIPFYLFFNCGNLHVHTCVQYMYTCIQSNKEKRGKNYL